jgi:putative transposase
MPRRRRDLADHSCYHLTHRCHKREFLLKFAVDRDRYCRLLYETARRFRISVLDYIITSNHIHLLVWSHHGQEISRAMQYLQGEFGQYYNMRKSRQGAFWTDRFSSTRIQSGAHLSRCLFYIDFNMVRAGVVAHPGDWKHAGYHELAGTRQRYCAIDQHRLRLCLAVNDSEDAFRQWYSDTVDEKAHTIYRAREAYWTEALAVGNRAWIDKVYAEEGWKRKKIIAVQEAPGPGTLTIEEPSGTYYVDSN